LPASDFWELFIECARCSHVVPRHLYPYEHQCSKRTKASVGEPSSDRTDDNKGSVEDELEGFLQEVNDAVAQVYPDEEEANAGPPLAQEALDSYYLSDLDDEDDDGASDDGWDSDLPTVLSLFQ
jgi:hypothetical protein